MSIEVLKSIKIHTLRLYKRNLVYLTMYNNM